MSTSRRTFLQQSLSASAAVWIGGETTGVGSATADAAGSRLITRGKSPYNAGAPLDELVQKWITPADLLFVRSHAATPKIDAKTFRLSVEGLVEKPLRLSPADLKRFDATSTVATLTCAGNRRYEHSRMKRIDGVQWREGAIGNARWQGVRLSAVLKAAGIKPGARHVWFEGRDEIDRKGKTIPFGGSIPIEKALGDSKSMPGAIVCTGMNGRPLPPDHGYPLRMVVPGYIGARSVKWLGRIVVSNRPSPNHYLANAYKVVTRGDKLELAEAGPIYAYPLNSVICTPKPGAGVKAPRVRVTGYALAQGRPGRTVKTVELSTDGRRWHRAKLTSPVREYCWALWSADLPVTAMTQQLIVRCTDSAGNTQPRKVAWNKKGYLYNAWHRVPVRVAD
ncbi:MAG: sulfite oxidase [Planctomycetaceae bacterium]